MEAETEENNKGITTVCNVTLPIVEVEGRKGTFDIQIYKVTPEWEEFLSGGAASNFVPDPTDEDFHKKISRAANTMYSKRGIGIASNQVGFKDRWFIIDTQWLETGIKKPRVLVNPVFRDNPEDRIEGEEGCLSVPLGFRCVCNRASASHIEYTDLNGNKVDWLAMDMDARAVGHEFDHLFGWLILDHASAIKRSMFEKKITKARKRAKHMIQNHNKNIIKQVKALNIKYNWSEKRKQDIADRDAHEEDNKIHVDQPEVTEEMI